MKREITTTVEVDGEIYIFRIQREDDGELTITTTPGKYFKIDKLIDLMFDEASHLL
jgi:hypothetical protein